MDILPRLRSTNSEVMELVLSAKITVEIDTNKGTYRQEFNDMEEAKLWYESIMAELQ